MALTSKEKRVSVYPQNRKPTVPDQVNAETPLEALDLNWSERELPQCERTRHVHGIHPYLGKFIPQLAEVFLRKYFCRGQTVLDPFAGSGTTLVQANELGINSIGYDISAFNVLLARVKTARYDRSRANTELSGILDKTRSTCRGDGRPPSPRGGASGATRGGDREYLKEWYAPEALRELLTYRHLIGSAEYRYRDLLSIVLSRAARSARMTPHYELDFPKSPQTEPYWCHKHRRQCSPAREALKFLERYTKDTLRRLEEYAALQTEADVRVYHRDSRRAEAHAIDGIVTSPPYVGLIDYHEQHSYAYHLLGLEDRRAEEIGAAAGGTSAKACEAYKGSIAAILRNAARKMRPGGRVIVVAADRRDLYGEILERTGLEEEAVVKRQVNRRTGRRSTEFFESVFIWRQPSR